MSRSVAVLASLAVDHDLTAKDCDTMLSWLKRLPPADRKIKAIGAVRALALYSLANAERVDAEEIGEDPDLLKKYQECA